MKWVLQLYDENKELFDIARLTMTQEDELNDFQADIAEIMADFYIRYREEIGDEEDESES